MLTWSCIVSVLLECSGCTDISSVAAGVICELMDIFCRAERKVSPSSRAEAWNMKSAPVHVPGPGGVLQGARSLVLLLCVYTCLSGCQEVRAA